MIDYRCRHHSWCRRRRRRCRRHCHRRRRRETWIADFSKSLKSQFP